MDLDQITKLFMWMSIINVALLILIFIMVLAMRKVICKMHGKLFGISPEQVALVLYWFLGVYKAIVIVFNIVPYVALILIQQCCGTC